MTARDHFAAAALTGMLASREWPIDSDEAAHYCYRVADAMLRERVNQPKTPDRSTPDADSRVWETQGHPKQTLTDAERKALDFAIGILSDAGWGTFRLRDLLKRLGGKHG